MKVLSLIVALTQLTPPPLPIIFAELFEKGLLPITAFWQSTYSATKARRFPEKVLSAMVNVLAASIAKIAPPGPLLPSSRERNLLPTCILSASKIAPPESAAVLPEKVVLVTVIYGPRSRCHLLAVVTYPRHPQKGAVVTVSIPPFSIPPPLSGAMP